MNPEEYGIKLADSEDLNSAAALYAAEIVNSLAEGIRKLRNSLTAAELTRNMKNLLPAKKH